MNLSVLYTQPTANIKDVEVEGKSFTIIKLPAFDSMKLSHKIAKVASPLLSVFNKKDEELDLSKIDFDDEKLSNLIREIVEMCQTENRMVLFNNDITSLKMPYLLVWEFLKFNYADFFQNSPLMEKVQKATEGLDLSKMNKV